MTNKNMSLYKRGGDRDLIQVEGLTPIANGAYRFDVVWRTSTGLLYTHGWRIMADGRLNPPQFNAFGRIYGNVIDAPKPALASIKRKALAAIIKIGGRVETND